MTGVAPTVDAFGARWTLDVRGVGEPLGDRLRDLWGRAVVTPEPDAPAALPFVVSRVGDEVHVDGARYRLADDAVPYAVSRALTVASIDRRAGFCLLLHAAAVARADGRTVALVAASGTGKTTAAAVLGRTHGYVTDETVAVEADLAVRAYPKPLSLVRDPAAPHDKDEVSPDALGLVRPPDRLRLTGVVLLDREPGAEVPRLDEVGLVEAAVPVVAQTSALLRLPDPLGSLADALSRGGGPWRLTYREIAGCAGLVDEVLGRDDPAPREPWSTERGPTADTDPGPGVECPVAAPSEVRAARLQPTTVVRRAPWRHALHTASASLVVLGSVPVGLPGLAATLWRATTTPLPVSRLVEVALDVHGAHPGAEDVVTRTVQALLGSGAFELDP